MGESILRKGEMVEFVKGGRAHGLKGQIKQVYTWTPDIGVFLIPEAHYVVWRTEDIRKI